MSMEHRRNRRSGEDNEEGDLFEVDRVLDRRTRKGKFEYLISWIGYGSQSNSWEPESGLIDAGEMVAQYERSVKKKSPAKKTSRTRSRGRSESRGRGRPTSKSRKTPERSKSRARSKTPSRGKKVQAARQPRSAPSLEQKKITPPRTSTPTKPKAEVTPMRSSLRQRTVMVETSATRSSLRLAHKNGFTTESRSKTPPSRPPTEAKKAQLFPSCSFCRGLWDGGRRNFRWIMMIILCVTLAALVYYYRTQVVDTVVKMRKKTRW